MSYPSGPQTYGQTGPQAYGQANDLDWPLRGASIGQAVSRFFKKYATFSGRASRSEFWWWFLVNFIISTVLSGLNSATTSRAATAADPMAAFGPVYWVLMLFALATLIPNLALGVRRLHDTNRSGWWLLIGLVPLIGTIVLIVFYATGPDPAGARYDRGGAPMAYPGQPYA